MAKKKYQGTIWQFRRKFYACFWIRGKQYRIGYYTREQAEQKLIEETLKKHRGRTTGSPNLKMQEIFDMVKTHLRVNERKTVGTESRRISNHLEPRFSKWKVSDFRSSDVEKYKEERKAEGASNATVNRELGLLITGFKLAFEAELIDYKVPVKRLPERSPRKEPFTDREFQTFRSHLPEDLGVAIDFQHDIGWRFFSEVACLRWEQIDWDEEFVSLQPFAGKEASPEPREFFFTARMRELLSAQRIRVDKLQKKLQMIITWVFPSDDGEPFFRIQMDEGVEIKRPSGYFRKCWKRAQKLSGCLKGTHHLRVTAAVERDNAGLSLEDNMTAGGWRSDVIRRYLKKSREDKKAVAKRLDEYRETINNTSTKKR